LLNVLNLATEIDALIFLPVPFNNEGGILKLSPGNEVVFDKNSYGDLVAKLTIANPSTTASVIYKIKTTSPDKYKVRPS
jgi:hypothetical protein